MPMKRRRRFVGNGVISFGIIGAGVYLGYHLLSNSKSQTPSLAHIPWDDVLLSGLMGAAVGAVVGQNQYDGVILKEQQEAFSQPQYLQKVLDAHKVDESEEGYQYGRKLADKVKQVLKRAFGEKLAADPIDWGSTALKTAIGGSYDFDLIIPFRRKSFPTIQAMYEVVWEVLHDHFGPEGFELREQTHSIGLISPKGFPDIRIDVVPGREENEGTFVQNSRLNLMVHARGYAPTYTLTTLDALKQRISSSSHLRKVIQLLKIYRDEKGLRISSTAISLMAVSYFKNGHVTRSLVKNMIGSMQYFVSYFGERNLVDPGNSNNYVAESLDSRQVQKLRRYLQADLDQLEANPQHWVQMFGKMN